ncbi:MAG TPA: STAS domain-containing protein, partial [Beijerinckiaceae bacterium]
RTATNIRAGAHGPVAGMLHAVFLLAFMMLAAPLAAWIPLAALAAVLAVVAWNMIEREQMLAILRGDRGEAAVLAATFLLTVFRDLTEGIAVGVVLGAILFMHRMAQIVEVTTHAPLLPAEGPDDPAEGVRAEPADADRDVVVYRIAGPFFFGAASQVAAVMEQIDRKPRAYVLDLSAVPLADETGAQTLLAFARKARRAGAQVVVAGASRGVRRALLHAGLDRRMAAYTSSVAAARERLARTDVTPAPAVPSA